MPASTKKKPLQPVERNASLGDMVYERLREYLRSGEVRWGASLREAALATRLGVSRTPVREALFRLASEGLIEAHGRSFTVPALSEADLEDIYELRVLLETAAVRQAAGRADGQQEMSEVGRALEAAEAAHARGDAEGFIAANRRFRAAWLSLVRNARLVRAVQLYADHVRALQFLTLGEVKRQRAVLQGMRHIHRALERQDPEDAVDAMRRYLGIAREAMQQVTGILARMGNVA